MQVSPTPMQTPQARMLAMPLSEWRRMVHTLSPDDLAILKQALLILAHHCLIAGSLRQHGMASRRLEVVQNHMRRL